MRAPQGTLLAVGRIAKVFGVKGDVIVQPLTDAPARFRTLSSVLIGRAEEQTTRVAVQRVQVEPRGVRLKLRGIDDRDAAEALVGSFLFVDEAHRIRLPRGAHFVHEMIGLAVVEEAGERVGTLREVLKMPANDIYVIERDGSEVLIPAVKEFVLGVDLRTRVMRVRLIEGMVEK